jgi:hypothetical protein
LCNNALKEFAMIIRGCYVWDNRCGATPYGCTGGVGRGANMVE